MIQSIQKLIKYRELLAAFMLRNIQSKYKQTIFGVMWAIFMPIVIILSGLVVKLIISTLSGLSIASSQIISVSIKALPWAFFIGALRFSVGSLVYNMHILQKVYFPRIIFPLGYILSQLFDFCIALMTLTLIFIFIKIPITIHVLWFPVVMSFIILYAMGLGFILSAANLFFRDVKHIIDVVLTFAIFFTPVFFEAHSLGKWETILMLNPIGAMLECINQAVVYHQVPDVKWMLYSFCWAVFTFIIGWVFFHKVEPAFVENI